MSIGGSLKRKFRKLKFYLRTNQVGYAFLRAIKYPRYLIKKEKEPLDKPRQQRVAIISGKLKIVFAGNGLHILWDSIELTTGCGLYTAFNTFGLWADSTNAEWSVLEHARDSMKLRVTYVSLPLAQTWSITLEDEQTITWQIDMDAEEWLHIDEFRVASFVNARYKNRVLIEPLSNDFLPLIQDPPPAGSAYLTGLKYAPAGEKSNYHAGNYPQFTGRIKLSENDLAWDEKTKNAKAPAMMDKKLNVLLVNLPWQKEGRWGVRAGSRWPHIKAESEGDYLPFPFFLAYATSLLQAHEIKAVIIDAIAEEMSEEAFLGKISGMNFDYLVVETSIPSYYHDLGLVKKISRKGVSIILCGPNSEIYQAGFLKDHPYIDFVLCGEYEFTLLELLQSLQDNSSLRNVAGLLYRDEGQIRKNLSRAPFDINLLPWPHRDSLPMQKYIDNPGGMDLPCAQIVASRGCPFKCNFCLWPQVMYQGNHYRFRSVKDVVDEMEFLVKEKGFQSVYFDDDTFNVGRERMLDFCREIRSRGLDRVQWAVMARPDLMDEELLLAMKKAGLWAIKYGMESANQALVDNCSKSMDLKKSDRMIRVTQKLGIKAHLTFTFGLLGETKQTMADTIEYVRRVNPFSAQFSITTPFPGTRYYRELKEKNFIVSDDLSCYDGNYKSVIKLENLSPEDLEAARARACQVWSRQAIKRRSLVDNARRFYFHAKSGGLVHAVSKVIGYIHKKAELDRQVASYDKAAHQDHVKNAYSEPPRPLASADILLIQCPPWDTVAPPLSIAYLSGYLKRHGFTVEIFDLNIELYNLVAKNEKYLWAQTSYDSWVSDDLFDQVWNKLGPSVSADLEKRLKAIDAKCIGLSVNFAGIKVAGEIILLIKAMCPEMRILVGGWGCTNQHMRELFPKELVDVFVVGEGEQTLREILEHARDNNGPPQIDGAIFNGIPGYEYTLRQPILDLDTIPWPTFSEFNLGAYTHRVLPLFGSRGCISRCSFCNDWPMAKPYRSRSAKNIFEEIKYHIQYNDIDTLSFKDLLCNGDMAILNELCDLIVKSGIKFSWDSQAIPRKEMTYDMLLKLKQAGCATLIYGIETFSNAVLKRMNKLFTKEIAEQVLKDTYNAGIKAMCNIIVGFPGETDDDFQETLDALTRNQRYLYQIGAISVCLVNAGSPFEQDAGKFGLVLSDDPKQRAKYWHSQDGTNTYQTRRKKAEMVIKLVEKLGFEYATKTI